MALTGSFNHYTWETSPTESSSVEISYPAGLDTDHPHYDLRGTTVTHWVSSSIATTHSYDGVYTFVQSAAVFNLFVEEETNTNNTRLSYTVRLYPSQENKNENLLENSTAEWSYDINWDWDTDTNPMVKAYNDIKNNNPDLIDI